MTYDSKLSHAAGIRERISSITGNDSRLYWFRILPPLSWSPVLALSSAGSAPFSWLLLTSSRLSWNSSPSPPARRQTRWGKDSASWDWSISWAFWNWSSSCCSSFPGHRRWDSCSWSATWAVPLRPISRTDSPTWKPCRSTSRSSCSR